MEDRRVGEGAPGHIKHTQTQRGSVCADSSWFWLVLTDSCWILLVLTGSEWCLLVLVCLCASPSAACSSVLQ